MKRLINARLSLFCVLGLVLGIFCFREVLFGDFWTVALCSALLIGATVVFACLKKRVWKTFLATTICVAVGFGVFVATYFGRNEHKCFNVQCELVGRVTDIGRNGNTKNTLYLENCTQDGEQLAGRVKVYVYDGTEFATGDTVLFFGTLRQVYLIKDAEVSKDLRYNVRYEMTSFKFYNVWHTNELTLAEQIRKYVFDVMQENMPQSGAIGYALLTGDRNAISEDDVSAFNSAGISHLLVVSGLHVGFIVAIFGWILRRLKLNALLEVAILLIPLLFYAYICDFAPSIMRAILMTVCLYFSRFLFGRYDLLTSVCWAAFFILLVQPLYLFDVGFQLSATSVFGIATIYLQIDRALRRFRINRFVYALISTLAMSFSCVTATFFLVARYYEQVAFLGIIVNVVAIPMVFVSFVLCLLGLIPGVFRNVLWLSNNILKVLVEVATFIKSLNAVISVKALNIAILVLFLLLFAVGGFVNLSKLGKRVFYPICAGILAVCMAFTFVPQKCQNCVKVFFGYDDIMVVATTENNNVAIVGNFSDEYVLRDALQYISNKKLNKVDIFVTECRKADTNLMQTLFETISVNKVYIADSSGTDNEEYFKKFAPTSRLIPNQTVVDDYSVKAFYDGGTAAMIVNVKDIQVACVIDDAKAQHISNVFPSACVVLRDGSVISNTEIATISFYQQDTDLNFGANKYGNFTIIQKDATIELNFRRSTP